MRLEKQSQMQSSHTQNEYAAAVERYQQALHLGKAIGDLVVKLNCLQGLGKVAKAQGDIELACKYYRQRLALADTHPYYKNSPATREMREEFASWGCDVSEGDFSG